MRDLLAAALRELARASGTAWARGMEAAARALVSGGGEAERLYGEAIAQLEAAHASRSSSPVHGCSTASGSGARAAGATRERSCTSPTSCSRRWARARSPTVPARELAATGATVRRRVDSTRDDLTAQEAQIARLAADGRSNPEIGARLFLSPRTVEYHLRKVYPKLGIRSRRDLRHALPPPARLVA